MKYIENWEQRQKRWIEVWAKENHDRPIAFLISGKDKKSKIYDIKPYKDLRDKWLDFDRIVKEARNSIENTYYAAESFPYFNPNLGPDIFGAVMGCDITFGRDTSWCNHPIENIADFIPRFDSENIWFKRIKELTEMAVEESNGDYIVGLNDIHAGMDALVSLRGPEKLCMDIYDNPEALKTLPIQIFENVYKPYFNTLKEITDRNQTGTGNWMKMWHPQKWYATSCDMNCMVSNDNFKEFIEPELRLENEFLDANIYHLDGQGALTQLDSLLAIDSLNGIQWVPGAGTAPMKDWVQLLLKIQNAGKMLYIDAEISDLKTLSEYLKPEGVLS